MSKKYKFQTKKDLHFARKLWHVFGVSLLLFLYLYIPYNHLLVIGSFATSFILLVDMTRLYFTSLNCMVFRVLGCFMREGEKKSLSGMSYMVLGAMTLAFLFPKEISVLALIFLGVGDPIASTIGVLYGKNKIGSKSLEGAMATFVSCSIVSVIYYASQGFFDHRIFLAVPLSGLLASLSELVQIRYVDDNFSFPVLSAFGLWVLFNFLGV